MPINTTQDWNNYWQGRSAAQTGVALTGVGIENNAVLNAFWKDTFTNLPKDTRLIDLACGAGSVLTHAQNVNMSTLTGVDISEDAINILKHKLPNISGFVCPLEKTPFEDDHFDIVVSQFGFEYAGSKDNVHRAAEEITRILRPDGKITLISHIKNGAIMRDCTKSLTPIKMIEKSQFFKAAKATFLAAHKANDLKTEGNKNKAEKAMQRLNTASKPIVEWLKSENIDKNNFAKFTYYLLQNANTLLQNYHKYERKDGLKWFDGMQHETIAYKGRMSSMINAALSEQDAENILTIFQNANFSLAPLKKLYFPNEAMPIAWVLQSK